MQDGEVQPASLAQRCLALFQLLPTSPPHRWLIAADWLEEQGADVAAAAFREGIWRLEDPDLDNPDFRSGQGDGTGIGDIDCDARGYGDGDGYGFGCSNGDGDGDGDGGEDSIGDEVGDGDGKGSGLGDGYGYGM